MRSVETEQLDRGACVELPYEVVDKYFMALPNEDWFHYLTAMAICGNCVVRQACLTEAIRLPLSVSGIRGGEPAASIIELHRRYLKGTGSAAALAADAIAEQRAITRVQTSPSLRSGDFSVNQPLVIRQTGAHNGK